MNTPDKLSLYRAESEFIGVIFDGAGNQLIVCSGPTDVEARSAALRNYETVEVAWAENGSAGDPPMWDLYKRGADAYHRYGKAEATVRGKWSNEN